MVSTVSSAQRHTPAQRHEPGVVHNSTANTATSDASLKRTALSGIQPSSMPTGAARFSRTNARCLLQAEAGITSAESQWPILGSFGANPCVIVAMHAADTRVVGMAHVDAITDIREAVNTLANAVQRTAKQSAQRHTEQEKMLSTTKHKRGSILQKVSLFLSKTLRPRYQSRPKTAPITQDTRLTTHLASAQLTGNSTLKALKAAILSDPRLRLGNVIHAPGLALDTRTGKLHTGDFKQRDFGKSGSLLANAIFAVARAYSNRLQPIDLRFINDTDITQKGVTKPRAA